MNEVYHNQGWFGRNPGIYDFASYFIAPMRRKAAKRLGKEKLSVLDVATGTGANALELAKLGHDVIGIDLDEKMLEKAVKKIIPGLQLEFLHADGTKLQFEDNRFDAVTISFAMHDVPYEIGINILKEASRVLKPQGIIYVVDYNEPISSPGSRLLYFIARWYESPNYKPFIKKGLKESLDKAGLSILEKSTFLGAVQFTKIQKI